MFRSSKREHPNHAFDVIYTIVSRILLLRRTTMLVRQFFVPVLYSPLAKEYYCTELEQEIVKLY